MRLLAPALALCGLLAAPAHAGTQQTAAAAPPAAAPSEAAEPALGPEGRDANGVPGRIHTVRKGDTLWAISNAYLGTPWAWPSVWKGNDAIANPHRIYPDDRIWISEREMRVVSDAEAEALLGDAPPAALEDSTTGPPLPDYQMNAIETTGIVTRDELAAATSILESPRESIWLAQMDTVSIGLGPGQLEVGDEFTIFRPLDTAYDPETERAFGRFVDVLGWARVTEVHDETASAEIVTSFAEIKRGDRVVPRDPALPDIDFLPAPAGLEGQVLHFPDRRGAAGGMDVVYLNRGAEHGVEVGNRFDVYRPGGPERDEVHGESRLTPDRVIGQLLVIKSHTETAVAVVTRASTELEWGDRFRTLAE